MKLREVDEEIGLRAAAHALDAAATLPPFLSKGRVSVRPVVACVGSRTFEPSVNEAEVAETFTVPLESFLDEEGHSHRDWEFLPGRVIRAFFERAGRVVWGLTASVSSRPRRWRSGAPRSADAARPRRHGYPEHTERDGRGGGGVFTKKASDASASYRAASRL